MVIVTLPSFKLSRQVDQPSWLRRCGWSIAHSKRLLWLCCTEYILCSEYGP